MVKLCNTAFVILFAVDGEPVGKMMWQRKMNLTQHFEPPIDNHTDNSIEKAAKELMKDMIQYTPNDRPTIAQVVDRLSALKEQLVQIGNYEIIVNENKKLGRPYIQSGAVYSGQHVVTKEQVAAKRYITEATNDSYATWFENERNMLQNIIKPHENIVQTYHFSKKDYEEDGKQMVEYWLIMELCNHCDLYEYAIERKLRVNEKLDIMIQSSRAVLHLHEQNPLGVVHRLITPFTLLVSGSNRMPIIKLSNFKRATTSDKDDYPFSMESCVSGIGFRAPEQTQRDDNKWLTQLMYDNTVDIFAMGISCLMLLEVVVGAYMEIPNGKYSKSHVPSLIYLQQG